jgi:hypothetical protein
VFDDEKTPLPRLGQTAEVQIDGQKLIVPVTSRNRREGIYLERSDGKWGSYRVDDRVRKLPGLQGPIDDAFLDRFIMVAPSGEGMHAATGKWVDAEMKHAIEHWRRQFRGVAIQKKDSEITDADIASSNLILWGDPASNKVLAKIIDKLPIKWNGKELAVGEQLFDVSHHMPVLIYPYPLNPKKYVVLNSGFTFREYDYLNNARQVPKLPDWAIVDVSQPMTPRAPGGIAAAGFFDEMWRVKNKGN